MATRCIARTEAENRMITNTQSLQHYEAARTHHSFALRTIIVAAEVTGSAEATRVLLMTHTVP